MFLILLGLTMPTVPSLMFPIWTEPTVIVCIWMERNKRRVRKGRKAGFSGNATEGGIRKVQPAMRVASLQN